jgi:ATP-dependent Lon protease
MKESAMAALNFLHSNAQQLNIPGEAFMRQNVHLHVPAGATPKDGPSAGITMATVLVSLATGIPIRRDVTMTGELTLRGRVLPVGGLKEKLLAAVRAGMHTAIVPAGNVAELSEIPEHLRQRIRIEPVHAMSEVLRIALARPIRASGWPSGQPVPGKRSHGKLVTHHRSGGAA